MIRESTSCVVEKGLAAFKASSGKKKIIILCHRQLIASKVAGCGPVTSRIGTRILDQ